MTSGKKVCDPGVPWLAKAHISPAIRAGNLVFVSGQLPMDRTGKLIGTDMPTQVEQCFQNVRDALQAAGVELEDVVKITTFVTDLSQAGHVFAARKKYFPRDPPASSMVEVSALYGGALVEIEAIAVEVQPASHQ